MKGPLKMRKAREEIPACFCSLRVNWIRCWTEEEEEEACAISTGTPGPQDHDDGLNLGEDRLDRRISLDHGASIFSRKAWNCSF